MSGLEILALATTAISTGVGVVSQMQQSKAQNAYAEAQNEVTRRQMVAQQQQLQAEAEQRELQARAAEANAAALDKKAGEQRAAAQAQAAVERKKAAVQLSQQRARFAASGAGLDGSALDVLGATAALGQTNSGLRLWSGEGEAAATGFDADQQRYQAGMLRFAKTPTVPGVVAAPTSNPGLGVASTILSGVSSGIGAYTKFNPSAVSSGSLVYDTPDSWTRGTTVRYG